MSVIQLSTGYRYPHCISQGDKQRDMSVASSSPANLSQDHPYSGDILFVMAANSVVPKDCVKQQDTRAKVILNGYE